MLSDLCLCVLLSSSFIVPFCIVSSAICTHLLSTWQTFDAPVKSDLYYMLCLFKLAPLKWIRTGYEERSLWFTTSPKQFLDGGAAKKCFWFNCLQPLIFFCFTLQVSWKTWKANCLDSTLHHASSWKLWLDSWVMKTRRSPWCSLCTDRPAQERTLLASWSLKTFTKREWAASLFMFLHLNFTSHIRVSWTPTRWDETWKESR